MGQAENKQDITSKPIKSFLDFDNEEMKGMSSFFDLFAQFNYHDKKKEKLVLKADLLVSAPTGSALSTNI